MLYYDCPACKMRCETTDAFAGKTVHCPHCGKQVTVPSNAISTAPPPRPRPAPTSTAVTTPDVAARQQTARLPDAPTGEEGSSTGLRNFILVVLGIIVLAGIGVYMLPGDKTNPKKKGGDTDFTDVGPSLNKFSDSGPIVVIDTSMGAIKVQLDAEHAPITTANFLKYVDAKHYDGLIFHRVIRDFMIQGGGFRPGMGRELPTGQGISNEAKNGLRNERGTIAMARTSDPNSATAQFFINTADNSQKLGPGGVDRFGYAVFGRVIDGMNVVDEIREVQTHTVGGHENVPAKDVLIKSIRRAEPK
jgi:cyclophilin family peptidyl-prolyl cis-trans isomerase